MRVFMKKIFLLSHIIFNCYFIGASEHLGLIESISQSQNGHPIVTHKAEFIDKVIEKAKESTNWRTYYFFQKSIEAPLMGVPLFDFLDQIVIKERSFSPFLPLLNMSCTITIINECLRQLICRDMSVQTQILKEKLQVLDVRNISKEDLQKKILCLSDIILFSRKLISARLNDAYIDKLTLLQGISLINNGISCYFEWQQNGNFFWYLLNTIGRTISLSSFLLLKKYKLKKGQEYFKQELEKILSNYDFNEV